MRRRRIALLMAMVLGITSISPVSLTGMAAEETPLETEVVGNMEDTMSVEPQSAENPEEAMEVQLTETEAAVQDTLVAETETIEAETAQGTEAAEETQAAEVLPQEPQTETETAEVTEAPQETETAAVTETMDSETEVAAEMRKIAEQEAAETESEIMLQTEDEYEVADLKLECSSTLYYVLEDTSHAKIIQNKQPSMTITYVNGESGYIYDIWCCGDSDSHGNKISVKTYRENGVEIPYNDLSNLAAMGAGSYYWEITCGEKTLRQDFKIFSLEEMKDSAVELQIGSNAMTAGYNNFYLYHFRTEYDTQIIFQGIQEGDLHLLCRNEKGDSVEWNLDSPIGGPVNCPFSTKIYGNQDYYFYSCSNSKEDSLTELILKERPLITGISKVSGQDEFLEKLDTCYVQNLTVEVSYANQPKQLVKFIGSSGSDSYGNTISSRVVDENGNSVYNLLPAGNYTLILFTAETSLEILIKVVARKDKVTEELDLDNGTNVTLKTNQAKWLRFTAENNYIYTFDVKKRRRKVIYGPDRVV